MSNLLRVRRLFRRVDGTVLHISAAQSEIEPAIVLAVIS